MKYALTLDASAIKSFETCNLLWAYTYRENLRLTGMKRDALDMGTLVHFLLEFYYKAKLNGANNLEAARISSIEFREKELATKIGFDREIERFLIERLTKYAFNYMSNDLVPVKLNEVSGVELGFSKILYEDENRLYILEGKIDLINQIGDGIYGIVDHKSQDRDSTQYYYTPQILTYGLATGYNYAMINYFGLQKEIHKRTFRRDTINIPNWMLKRWKNHLVKNVFRKIEYIDRMFQDTTGIEEKPVLNEIKFEQTPSSCPGAFNSNPCMFHYLCETQSQEMIDNLKKFKYEIVPEWKPWKLKENQDEL